MKKLINLILLLTAGAMPAIAQNDADPALASVGFAASPVIVGNTTKLQVNFTNNAFTTAIAPGAVALSVSLPVSTSYTASPASNAAISGGFSSNFTWTYTPATNNFRGVLNSSIPAGGGGLIEFTVIGVQNTNGAQVLSTVNIQRLLPALIPNEDVTNNSLSAGLAVAPSPLPLNMQSFTANKNECAARLSWITTNEQNTSHFEVEASNDGKVYKMLGSVKAAGNSSEKKYYNYEYQMESGVEYLFRLKMVDLNGSSSYTPVLRLNCGDHIKSEVTVAPNPVINTARIDGMSTGDNVITILDVKGSRMQTITTANAFTDIDVSNYAPGIYTVRIQQGNGDVVTKKLVKQ